MAYAGQIIQNPVSGERIHFLRTSADTDGELLEFELELSPDGHVPGAHVHPEQEERFHVLEGDDEVPPRHAHDRRRPGRIRRRPCRSRAQVRQRRRRHRSRARVEVAPALDMEQLLETTVELAHEGRVTRKGMPKPLHLALFVRRYEREVRAPFPPAWVVRALMAPVAALARRRGHAERYVLADIHAPQPLAA